MRAIPGTGSCGGMYTANTMSSAFEALGMSLPFSSTMANPHDEKQNSAKESAKVLIEAIKKKKKVIFCNFFKHDKKYKIVKSYFDSIKGFSRVNNIKKLINLINSLKKGDKVLYNNYDLSIVNRLRGFKNEKKCINDYKIFYNFLIKKYV
jgi:hypothetical protein